MKLPLLLALTFAGTVSFNQAVKVAMLSDVHILPIYDPTMSNTCYCTQTCAKTQKLRTALSSTDYAPLGRLYCDPPQELTEVFLQKL